ncbi:MAG TPA: LuxR C-terminal-related transcriptional regulator [Steroidobacteraceae bacterium]|nr:LuxR C-terminal-related transcriptional regulator [Steroidobacteraceae bacterium]
MSATLPYRYAPRPSSGQTVTRKSLLRNLTEATLLKQLSLVRGPAGSGKTTLLGQWRAVCRDMDRPVAWLTVDAGDQDPLRFVSGLAAAAGQAGCSEIAEGFGALVTMPSNVSTVQLAQQLASLCNTAGARLVIVLDQYERANTPAIGDLLSGFLDHAVTTRLVIASRKRLEVSLAGLRARDQVFEIGPSDLNLTPLETHGLFAGVPELYTRRLQYETSGEAVALGFVRRVMEVSQRDLPSADDWQDQLYEYYRSEVLEALPAQMRESISRLVIVERFDLSLASALIGHNATDLIERLHRIDGILLRHRGSQEFYFPEMLRRFLETRLAWLAEDEHQAAHRRAAAWFAGRNRNADALRHAVAAGDRARALELLDKVGYASLVIEQGVVAAHELLQAVGVAPQGGPTDQHLSLAVILAHEGNLAEADRHLEEARIAAREGAGTGAAVSDQLAIAESVVAGLRDDTQHARTAPALERFLATSSESDHENRGLAYVFLSWDRFWLGDIKGAEELVNAAAREYGETEAIYAAIFMHVHRVLYRYWLNDLERALEESTLAEQVTRIFFPHDQRLRALVAVIRAGLLFELGQPDPLTDMTALVGTVGALEPWPEIQIWSHLQAARAALTQGGSSEARGIVAYGAEVAKRLSAPRLSWALRLLSVEISLKVGEIDRAEVDAMALNICGRQAILHLPSYLTWQERIGAALVAARIAECREDHDRAKDLIDLAREMASNTSVIRLAVQVEIAEARLSHGRGDIEGSARHFAAARKLCRGSLPVRLFLDGGDGLRICQPEITQLAHEPPQARSALEEPVSSLEDPLTTRERQILMLLGEGHQNKVAAHRLGLSEATVKFHLRNIYRKLQAQNRTQALARYRTLAEVHRG